MQAVIDKIMNAKSVAILPHVNEDPDALGSCFAFAKAMRLMGKTAHIYVSGRIEARLAFIGNDYTMYTEDTAFDGHDLCVCLDCGDEGRLGDRKAIFETVGNTVNIDHHFTNDCYADANYVDGDASATGEILFELFEKMGLEITADIARDLYIAISSDTGSFKYSNVTPKTMRTAAALLEYGFDHAEVARRLFDTETLAAAKFKAEVTEGIRSFADGKIKAVLTDETAGEKYGIHKEDIPNLVEIPRRIEGTEIAMCLKRTEAGFRLNLRSNSDADVAKVAMQFGGGGHVKAAGATLNFDNCEDALQAVVAACEIAIEEAK